MMCTYEEDVGELEGVYDPVFRARIRQRSWWLHEIDVVWDSQRIQLQSHFHMVRVRGKEKDTAFTHKHLSPHKKEETSKLDYIIGPMRRSDEVIHPQ